MPTLPTSRAKEALGDPALRQTVERFVRRRVPSSDVEDVVQTVFVDALAAAERPTDPAELARWLLGIARHKVVDRHRRAVREPAAELPEIPTAPAPMEARALAKWAEEQAGDDRAAQRTLDWMAREGEGEKLDAIAADEKIPPARVRQRVSRMRRWMKERWAAELAAVAMLAVLAVLAWWLLSKPEAPPEAHDDPGVSPTIVPEPPSSLDRARALRADALRACDRSSFRECVDGLDQAKALDPIGDGDPAVGAARAKAERAMAPVAPPAPDASSTAPIPQKDTSDEKGELKKSPAPTATTPSAPKAPPAKPVSKPKASDFEERQGTPSGAKSGGLKKRASTKVLDSETLGN
jgi:DNA-directed RNA polymerase specialized sigma24 family protein